MAKHVLNTGDEEQFPKLIGITCSLNQYELVSLLNDVLSIDLALSDYVPLQLKQGKIFMFSLFSWEDPALAISYNLVPNASNFDREAEASEQDSGLFSGEQVEESVRLIRELPQTDYLLMLQGEVTDHQVHKIYGAIRTSEQITSVQQIEPATLPSRRNLIF